MERRSYFGDGLKIEKRGEGANVLHGYAAVFYRDNDPGTEYELRQGLKERVTATAFNKAITAERDVKAMWNHKDLLGSRDNGTLRLSIDQRGLKYEIDLPDTQAGRDVATLVERGDVRGSSFGFLAKKAPIQRGATHSIRSIEEAELLDVGPVAEPAYKGTTAGMRSDNHDEALKEFSDFQNMLRANHQIKLRNYLHNVS
jgi:HK97 family phage prohead protease